MIHKKLISSTVILTTLGIIGGSAITADAQESSSQGILSVLDVTEPEAPPAPGDEDGDGGGVVDPGEPSEPGEISISKITDWNFGTLDNYDPALGASLIAARAENNTFNHVVVDDRRDDAGLWTLSVRSEAFQSGTKSLTGTTISLGNLRASNYNDTATFSGPSSLQLLQDNESVEVLTALNDATGFTTLSLGEVELSIPQHQNIDAGEEYTSVITWDLTVEPA